MYLLWVMVVLDTVGCHNNTDNKKDAGRVIHFHKFPLENEQLCTKWVIATKLEDFVPKGHHFLCSDHSSFHTR